MDLARFGHHVENLDRVAVADRAVRQLDENRVAIDIIISEGISATIKSINLTGNQFFDEAELLDIFELEPSSEGWLASDEYSRSKLTADLETLKSYYLDRGFIRYNLVSQQVSISPDRKDISISINIEEGEPYRIGTINIGGEMVVPEFELRALVTVREGDIFSLKEVNRVVSAMQKRLGEDGYAFAEVRVARQINEEDKTVALRFLLVPGKKMRIRYINFNGNEKPATRCCAAKCASSRGKCTSARKWTVLACACSGSITSRRSTCACSG